MSDLLKLPCGGGLFDSESFSIEKKNGKEYIKAKNKGGVSSWNDLTDKPFGEEGWSITWDGDTDGREIIETHPTDEVTAVLYKVSGLHLTAEDLKSATMVVHNASMLNFPESVVIGESASLSVFEDTDGSVSVFGNEALELVRSTHDGTYILLADLSLFGMSGFAYATELCGSTIKTIDPKFLPEQASSSVGALTIKFTIKSKRDITCDTSFETVKEAYLAGRAIVAIAYPDSDGYSTPFSYMLTKAGGSTPHIVDLRFTAVVPYLSSNAIGGYDLYNLTYNSNGTFELLSKTVEL